MPFYREALESRRFIVGAGSGNRTPQPRLERAPSFLQSGEGCGNNFGDPAGGLDARIGQFIYDGWLPSYVSGRSNRPDDASCNLGSKRRKLICTNVLDSLIMPRDTECDRSRHCIVLHHLFLGEISGS